MSDAKNSGVGMLNSILSGIVLAALTGVGTMQIKNNEKLSDIRAVMVSRDEVDAKILQMRVDLKAIELASRADFKSLEMMCHANAVAIGELQIRIENTVRTRTQ